MEITNRNEILEKIKKLNLPDAKRFISFKMEYNGNILHQREIIISDDVNIVFSELAPEKKSKGVISFRTYYKDKIIHDFNTELLDYQKNTMKYNSNFYYFLKDKSLELEDIIFQEGIINDNVNYFYFYADLSKDFQNILNERNKEMLLKS